MNQHTKRFITAWVIATFFWMIFFYCPPVIFSATLVGILITILFVEWGQFFPVNSWRFWIVTPLYPILPFALMIYMNQVAIYRPMVYYLFLLVFSFDAGSYIAGSLFGKHLILPKITPKKTYEGAIGGYFSALVIFLWALYEKQIMLSPQFIIGFTVAVCVIAFFGDLFESYLKRSVQLKDSGCILPGHGGFLDRFDAIMVTTFFFFAFKDWLILYLH